MKSKLIGLVIFLAFIVIPGCAKTEPLSKPQVDIDNLSPQQLVETYYTSLSSGDLATAEKCLSDDMKKIISSPDSDFHNLKKLYNLEVSQAYPIKLYAKNHDEVQVVAQYSATYKKFITTPNGHQTRFIYVAKAKEDSPWRIISIGTGP